MQQQALFQQQLLRHQQQIVAIQQAPISDQEKAQLIQKCLNQMSLISQQQQQHLQQQQQQGGSNNSGMPPASTNQAAASSSPQPMKPSASSSASDIAMLLKQQHEQSPPHPSLGMNCIRKVFLICSGEKSLFLLMSKFEKFDFVNNLSCLQYISSYAPLNLVVLRFQANSILKLKF